MFPSTRLEGDLIPAVHQQGATKIKSAPSWTIAAGYVWLAFTALPRAGGKRKFPI
jgi:hypothetical protein